MLLQAREGTHVADSSFDRILQSDGFVGSGRNDDDFSSLDSIPLSVESEPIETRRKHMKDAPSPIN